MMEIISLKDLREADSEEVRASYFSGDVCWRCEKGISINDTHGMCYPCYREIMNL